MDNSIDMSCERNIPKITGKFIRRDEFLTWFNLLCLGDEKFIREESSNAMLIILYTHSHVYRIHARYNDKEEVDYLGCISQNRSWNFREDWNRGCDLPDGKFTEEVANEIIKGIYMRELVWK